MKAGKKSVRITEEQLQDIIKEGVAKLHKRTILENEKKVLMEELTGILFENEVASPEVVEILDSYLEAALWTDEEEIGHANIHSDVNVDSRIDAYKDVVNFMNQAGELINGLEPSQVGHDLWLTRNGHGAGFWDRGLGDVGENLSNIARSMGGKSVYRGDNEEIYIN